MGAMASQGDDTPNIPDDVQRAVDYVHRHLAEPITIEEIVKASGSARRTLFKHFRDFGGTTPMGYRRSARFARVRDMLMRGDLMRGDSRAGVTAIALEWGFCHLGRFSAEYRRRFG